MYDEQAAVAVTESQQGELEIQRGAPEAGTLQRGVVEVVPCVQVRSYERLSEDVQERREIDRWVADASGAEVEHGSESALSRVDEQVVAGKVSVNQRGVILERMGPVEDGGEEVVDEVALVAHEVGEHGRRWVGVERPPPRGIAVRVRRADPCGDRLRGGDGVHVGDEPHDGLQHGGAVGLGPSEEGLAGERSAGKEGVPAAVVAEQFEVGHGGVDVRSAIVSEIVESAPRPPTHIYPAAGKPREELQCVASRRSGSASRRGRTVWPGTSLVIAAERVVYDDVGLLVTGGPSACLFGACLGR